MNEKLKEKIQESFSSVLPITILVMALSIFVVPLEIDTIVMFLMGAFLLILGMGFFSLGADMSMIPMGEGIGVELTKTKKITMLIIICFLIGFMITIAEPDLVVLAQQVAGVPDMILICIVAVGVGIFLVITMLRILFQISLSKMLIVFYSMLLVVSLFVPDNFIAVAFDSGGVTTGPITVPFILALGLGLASIRGDKNSQDDSFGLVALCSIGPIIAVMILGIVYSPQDARYEEVVLPKVLTMQDVMRQFTIELPHFLKEVLLALVPICIFFSVFQLISRRFRKHQLQKIIIGLIYTMIGLVLFLTGVNVGFIPVGNLIGAKLASESFKWLLVPIGMLIGYFIVAAEPAVHILNRQVEEVSEGAISPKVMNRGLSIGVAVSVGLSMIRVLTGISIYWFLIPGYVLALFLTFKVPKIISGIAFDSGGVASGPMTSTFLLPFAMGACDALGGNILIDAFGAVAMVAMTPLIAIQLMGLIYIDKTELGEADIDQIENELKFMEDSEEITNYEEVEEYE